MNDQTDVWFAQHMVPHLLQDTSIAYLSRDELTDPDLALLADRIHRRSQAQAAQLLEWLAERGLAPHGHSHQRGDRLRRSDLERLSRLDGAALDLAFADAMTARDRAGGKLAATEAREGSAPAIRELAQQLLAEQQARIATLRSWRRAGSKSHASRPPATAPRHRCAAAGRSSSLAATRAKTAANSRCTSRQSRPLPGPGSAPQGPPP